MRFRMWFSAFRIRNGYPSSVSKSSAKPGSSCVVSASGFSAIAFAAVRTHFPKRVNARLMPSARAAGRDHAAVVSVHEDVPALLVLFVFQVGILPKTAGGCRAFFTRLSSRIKKWVNSSLRYLVMGGVFWCI